MRRMYSKKQIEKIAKESIDKAYEFLASIEYDEFENTITLDKSIYARDFQVNNTEIYLGDDGLWLSGNASINISERDGSEVITTGVPFEPSSMPTIVEAETSFEWNGTGSIDLTELQPYTIYDVESDEFGISGGENITFLLPSFVKFVFVTGETTSQGFDNSFVMELVQEGTIFSPEGATLTILLTDCIAYVLYSY